MSQLQSDKFNVAWFKLAEFVSRKEKERALGIYKLLVHSLPNEAIAAQLEGDLLLAFHDDKALQSYTRAVELYERSEDFIKAIAACEHCLTLMPDSIYHLERVLRLYLIINDMNKALHYAEYCGKMLGTKHGFERCEIITTDITLDHACRLHIAHSFIIEIISNKPCALHLLEKPLTFILDGYTTTAPKKLNGFLTSLELLHGEAFAWATRYLQEQNVSENNALKMDDKK